MCSTRKADGSWPPLVASTSRNALSSVQARRMPSIGAAVRGRRGELIRSAV
ncbi:hypothetical protein ACFVRD_40235 [Streptomyces sp. NPDC057908]|uniref:hypothetical protein n=1 Tax=Streptomyces sp. NPDC057908 TaxID=3346276 RepID=UPI0036ED38BE